MTPVEEPMQQPAGPAFRPWRFENGTSAVPVYVEGSRGPLFAWWHVAGRETPAAAFVIVSSVAHEYMYAHHALRHLAARLAAEGYPVLRYDHHGVGDSAGAHSDPDLVRTWTADIARAVADARTRSGASRVAVIGFRAGALLSLAAAAGAAPLADALVLWCPPDSGRSFMREVRASGAMLRRGEAAEINPRDPEEIEVAGFVLSGETARVLGALRPSSLTAAPAARVLMVERDDLRPSDDLAGALDTSGATVSRRRASGYRELMVDSLLSRVPQPMIDEIVAWVRRSFPQHGDAGPASIEAAHAEGVSAPVFVTTHTRERPLIMGDARPIFGVLGVPASAGEERAAPRRTCVVLLNTGGDLHVGPGRLHVELARDLAASGFPTFRMDLHGLGDAAPLARERPLDAYPAEASQDILTAMSGLRATGRVGEIVLGGMCSGAFHAIEAVQLGIEVAGVVAINPQLFYERAAGPLASNPEYEGLVRQMYEHERIGWRQRLRYRLRLRKRLIASTLSRTVVPIAARMASLVRRGLGREVKAERTHFRRICPTLLVFSEGDPGLCFLETRAATEMARLRADRRFRIRTVREADHTFTNPRASAELRMHVVEFLSTRFG